MSGIDEIKKKLSDGKYDYADHHVVVFGSDDIEYLLSKLEAAEKALEHCVEIGECQLDYGGSMDALEKMAETATQALNDIRS